ncbi:MAG: AAA family ATPase [Thermomicrobiales bacterium]
MERCRQLSLGNWRNFVAADAVFEDRAFIVGPNASGKSNLLDALCFLADLVAVGGGFQEAVRRRGGLAGIRSSASATDADVTIRTFWESGDGGDWEYSLTFGGHDDGTLVVKAETVRRGGAGDALLDRPNDDDRADPQRLTQTHLEQVQVNQRFRRLAEFFAAIRYVHIVPQIVRASNRSGESHFAEFGEGLIDAIASTPATTRLARLRRVRNILRVAIPGLSDLDVSRDKHGAAHLRARFGEGRASMAWQDERLLSDGTVRLAGLLWALLDGTGLILLEEPESSLHSALVRYLPQMLHRAQRLTGRQVFMTAHSPILFSDGGIGLDEVFLMQPTIEGSLVSRAKDFDDIRHQVEAGIPLADILTARTAPADVQRFALLP